MEVELIVLHRDEKDEGIKALGPWPGGWGGTISASGEDILGALKSVLIERDTEPLRRRGPGWGWICGSWGGKHG